MKLSSLKQQVEELDAKATKGPWYHDLNGHIAPCDGNEWLPTVLLLNNFDRESSEEQANLGLAALSRTALPELLRRLLVAEEALDRIKRPVWWMQEDQRRKTGSINGVSGAQAVALSNDPNYLREIATAALAAIRGEEE